MLSEVFDMNTQHVQGIRIDWDKIDSSSYIRSIDALNEVTELHFLKAVTFFVGENGSGKSTLLEAMAVAAGFNPEGGTRNYRFSTYNSHSQLYDAVRIIRGVHAPRWGYFLRAESFYNVATKEMDYEDAKHPSRRYHEKSHGESFLDLAQTQLKPNGIYFLDEPEAALSPQRQLTLLTEIARCVNDESQFFIVTHSPILLGFPDAQIFTFDQGPIHECEYEDTDSYQITKMFLSNRKQFLSRLLTSE